MRKQIPYILIGLLLIAVIVLFLTGNNKKSHRFDPRITLRKQDKIPYGTYVAYQNLEHMFPQAEIYTNRSEPGYWDSLYTYEKGQVYFVVASRVMASENEMKKILDFVENGNDVFISARYLSADADKVLRCTTSAYDPGIYSDEDMNESMQITLSSPPFAGKNTYRYPGKKFNSYFSSYDTSTTRVLGHDEGGHPNFVQFRAGEGNLFIQLEPLAFSNYFLLHKENISYYEKALSLVNANARRVVWDEYFLSKRYYYERPERKTSWLGVLFRYPSLKAALLTAIITLLLYTLLEMRRKQRIIPVITRPRNDSMDFVRTIGRLYYDKGDHQNLSRKMAAYFLEYVRNRYKLVTVNLDEQFISNLRFKTNCEENEIRDIVSFIKKLDESPNIHSKQLSEFHRKLEAFYKKA